MYTRQVCLHQEDARQDASRSLPPLVYPSQLTAPLKIWSCGLFRPRRRNNECVAAWQGVATVCTTHGHHNRSALPINLSTEAGSMGGVPVGGLRFGASHNAASHMPCATMIDFYNGGGVDVACLGMAEVSCCCCAGASAYNTSHCDCIACLSCCCLKHSRSFCCCWCPDTGFMCTLRCIWGRPNSPS